MLKTMIQRYDRPALNHVRRFVYEFYTFSNSQEKLISQETQNLANSRTFDTEQAKIRICKLDVKPDGPKIKLTVATTKDVNQPLRRTEAEYMNAIGEWRPINLSSQNVKFIGAYMDIMHPA